MQLYIECEGEKKLVETVQYMKQHSSAGFQVSRAKRNDDRARVLSIRAPEASVRENNVIQSIDICSDP